jgi:tyrosine-specific transport protein
MIAKIIGSTLIITGTTLGAGILALPIVSSNAGFGWSFLLLVAIWLLLTYTALLVLEVALALPPEKNSFQSMARATLGLSGQVLAWLSCVLLLYALTCAYISGDSSLLDGLMQAVFGIHMPAWLGSLLFTLVFGGIVFYSTRAVDILNRWLLSVKGITLILAVVLLLPHIQFTQLISEPSQFRYIWAAVPIFLTGFGFHTVIPSLVNYIGPKPKVMKWIVIMGAFFPLVLYAAWLMCTLGMIPRAGDINSFQAIATHQDSLSVMLQSLFNIAHNHVIESFVDAFANIAMTTSFLGVTLGLFDFLADGCKRPNTRSGRAQTALITFVPPFVFAVFYPQGFIMALGYATIMFAVLGVILPALMAWKLRRHTTLVSPYRVWGGDLTLWLIVLIGVALIVLQILSQFHQLPV